MGWSGALLRLPGTAQGWIWSWNDPHQSRGFRAVKRLEAELRDCSLGGEQAGGERFGAAVTRTSWAEARRTFEWLGSSFSDCTAYEIEVVAAGASGELAYLVAFEHITASVNGAPPEPYTLRVTTVFRREDGEWRVAHRHGDSLKSRSGAGLVQQLEASDR